MPFSLILKLADWCSRSLIFSSETDVNCRPLYGKGRKTKPSKDLRRWTTIVTYLTGNKSPSYSGTSWLKLFCRARTDWLPIGRSQFESRFELVTEFLLEFCRDDLYLEFCLDALEFYLSIPWLAFVTGNDLIEFNWFDCGRGWCPKATSISSIYQKT